MGQHKTNEERRSGGADFSIQMLQDVLCEQPLTEHAYGVEKGQLLIFF
jgi:hypothetical protein